ncbi:MAG: class I SAM-dependent methyltransferase [Gaiellaceae bacterium]
MEATDSYFDHRLPPDPRRDRVWRHVVAYLSRWWSPSDHVVDVGAGYCSFINNVVATRRVAVDTAPALARYAAPGVEWVQESATTLTRQLGESEFDLVFASNLLEHLTRHEIWTALNQFRTLLRDGGKLMLVQPNFRLRPAAYFDDYTHITPLSDRSLSDLLSAAGFTVIYVRPRFLPLTLRSRLGAASFAVPLYLRSPWRPLAGQMLLVARRAPRAPAA